MHSDFRWIKHEKFYFSKKEVYKINDVHIYIVYIKILNGIVQLYTFTSNIELKVNSNTIIPSNLLIIHITLYVFE